MITNEKKIDLFSQTFFLSKSMGQKAGKPLPTIKEKTLQAMELMEPIAIQDEKKLEAYIQIATLVFHKLLDHEVNGQSALAEIENAALPMSYKIEIQDKYQQKIDDQRSLILAIAQPLMQSDAAHVMNITKDDSKVKKFILLRSSFATILGWNKQIVKQNESLLNRLENREFRARIRDLISDTLYPG